MGGRERFGKMLSGMVAEVITGLVTAWKDSIVADGVASIEPRSISLLEMSVGDKLSCTSEDVGTAARPGADCEIDARVDTGGSVMKRPLAVITEGRERFVDGVGSTGSVAEPKTPMASEVLRSSRAEGAPAEESARPETSDTAKTESCSDALERVTETDVVAVALRLFSAIMDGMALVSCSRLPAPVRAGGPLEEILEAFELL